jgi:hypothetical protein
MHRSRFQLWTAALAGLTALPVLCVAADGTPGAGQQQVKAAPAGPAPLRVDAGKSVIELPLKGVIASATTPVSPVAPAGPGVRAAADRGKGRIERPVEKVVASTTPADKTDNPKVEPGKVKWHKDFAAACAAAKKSGKPVLLFEMMGRLDEKFC